MKERSSVQNIMVLESRDKRQKEREIFMRKRRSHQIGHNVEDVIGHDDNLAKMAANPTETAQEPSPAKWAGMNINSGRKSSQRFIRTKDFVSDWNDQMLVKAYMYKHSGHELSSKLTGVTDKIKNNNRKGAAGGRNIPLKN